MSIINQTNQKEDKMQTITKLQKKFGSTDLDHLLEAFGDAEVPVIAGKPQHQGDLFIVPMRKGNVEGLEKVPTEGVAVIRGEAGGNTHLLLAEGDVQFARAPQTRTGGVLLGTMLVGEGGIAVLHHIEHGYNLVGPGMYSLRGKRTQMSEVTRVTD